MHGEASTHADPEGRGRTMANQGEQMRGGTWGDILPISFGVLAVAVAGIHYSRQNGALALLCVILAIGSIVAGLWFRRSANSRTSAWWVDLLAILHGTGALCLGFFAGFYAAAGVGHHQLWYFGMILIIISWGLWFRRPWIPLGIRMVYGIVSSIPLFWVVYSILNEPKHIGIGGFVSLMLIVYFWVWVPVAMVALLVDWAIQGRGRKQIFLQDSVATFTLQSFFVWMTLVSLIFGGFLSLIQNVGPL